VQQAATLTVADNRQSLPVWVRFSRNGRKEHRDYQQFLCGPRGPAVNLIPSKRRQVSPAIDCW